MKKILFACDLDNTLIHSFKSKKPEDVCVEILRDKEQGFMSKEAIRLLSKVVKEVELVPVTSRSIEQYLRIQWPDGCKPRYAITTNGAILLENERVVKEWQEQSANLVAPYMDHFKSLLQTLIDEDLYIRCRIVDDMYLFAYCKDGVDIYECKKRYGKMTDLDICPSGKKLYFFPPMFNKGEALKRFEKYGSFDFSISAGDSSIDLPMLAVANQAYVPNAELLDALMTVSNKKAEMCRGNELFAEFILSSVLEYNNSINNKKHSD